MLASKSKMYAVSVVAVIIFVLGTGVCWADDCSVGRTADGVYPVNDADVTMLSEDIHIGVETGLVDCNFVFQNNSDADKDILMGFPAKTKEYEEGPAAGDPEVHDFKAYVEGTEVPVQMEKETFPEQGGNTSVGSYDSWYVFDVNFPAGSTLAIRNTYSVSNTVYSTGEVSLGYVLKTGAVWEGKIGHARVVFDFENIQPYELTSIFPSAMLIKDNEVVWERDNIEPGYNLSLMYNKMPYTQEYLNMFPAEDQAKMKEKIDFDKKAVAVSATAGKDELKKMYDQALINKNFIIARYIECCLLQGQAEIPSVIKVNQPNVTRGDDSFYTVEMSYSNKNNDITIGAVLMYHMAGGKQVIDYSDMYDLNWYEQYGGRIYNFGLTLDPQYEYFISSNVFDSYGQYDQKEFVYSPSSGTIRQYEQTE